MDVSQSAEVVGPDIQDRPDTIDSKDANDPSHRPAQVDDLPSFLLPSQVSLSAEPEAAHHELLAQRAVAGRQAPLAMASALDARVDDFLEKRRWMLDHRGRA